MELFSFLGILEKNTPSSLFLVFLQCKLTRTHSYTHARTRPRIFIALSHAIPLPPKTSFEAPKRRPCLNYSTGDFSRGQRDYFPFFKPPESESQTLARFIKGKKIQEAASKRISFHNRSEEFPSRIGRCCMLQKKQRSIPCTSIHSTQVPSLSLWHSHTHTLTRTRSLAHFATSKPRRRRLVLLCSSTLSFSLPFLTLLLYTDFLISFFSSKKYFLLFFLYLGLLIFSLVWLTLNF